MLLLKRQRTSLSFGHHRSQETSLRSQLPCSEKPKPHGMDIESQLFSYLARESDIILKKPPNAARPQPLDFSQLRPQTSWNRDQKKLPVPFLNPELQNLLTLFFKTCLMSLNLGMTVTQKQMSGIRSTFKTRSITLFFRQFTIRFFLSRIQNTLPYTNAIGKSVMYAFRFHFS